MTLYSAQYLTHQSPFFNCYLDNADSFPGQVVGSITTESQHHNQNLITVRRITSYCIQAHTCKCESIETEAMRVYTVQFNRYLAVYTSYSSS